MARAGSGAAVARRRVLRVVTEHRPTGINRSMTCFPGSARVGEVAGH
ncbi:MAG: hypothetical protein GY820_18410 [Gammaproteobacteria bacterium]|nr:hypothetical protein [Gammaproteobacteria bacterium]